MAYRMTLHFFEAYKENNKLYFSAWNTNGLFCYDIEKKKTDFLCFFPYGRGKADYGYYCETQEQLFFSPCNGDAIVEFTKGKWDTAQRHMIKGDIGCLSAKFGAIHYLDGNLWLVPYSAHVLLQYEITAKRFKHYSECYQISEKRGLTLGPIFRGNIVVGSRIWFACIQSNLLFCFDTENKKFDYFEVGNSTDVFRYVGFDGNDFWIFTDSGDFLKWNVTKGLVMRIDNPFQEVEGQTFNYYQGNIWLASGGLRRIARIDTDSGKTTMEDFSGVEDSSDTAQGSFKVIGDILCSMPSNGEFMYVINTDTHKIEKHWVGLFGDAYEDYQNRWGEYNVKNAQEYIIEDDNFSLDTFLRGVKV